MNLELDHVFILVEPEAKVADLVVALGIKESFSRDHQGQGTSNRRFEFANGMLEFLWIRDAEEAINGPGKNLMLPERTENQISSPFGVVLTRQDNSDLSLPFGGWSYQSDYFEPPMAFHVGENSVNLVEPLCVYVPFIEPTVSKVEKSRFKLLSHVKITVATAKPSDVLAVVSKAERLSFAYGEEHLMEITLDNNVCGLSKDFRPDLPLVIHW